ncbi:hypothetical protein [Streptomyces sp. NPDC056983]|uniref:hypothetical protein n=1 Tax=Streptomyces sp. NPDC056983 TaxID=3345987 RepID=UPI00363866DA
MSQHSRERPADHRASVGTPTAVNRRNRLTRCLAEIIPDARTIQVTLHAPARTWPSPYATAYDAAGRRLALNQAQARTAARWIIRACPEAEWHHEHVLDLASGSITNAPAAAYSMDGAR